MKFQSSSRHAIAMIILICYLLPIFLLSAYSLVQKDSWTIFSIGLTVGFLGTGLLFLVICRWEQELQQREVVPIRADEVDFSENSDNIVKPSVSLVETITDSLQTHEPLLLDNSIHDELAEYKVQQAKLLSEIENKSKAFSLIVEEKESVQRQLKETAEEFAFYKKVVLEQVQQQDQLIKKCQDAILEQQNLVETKQQQIAALEIKERDLMYEIKTLLQVVNLDI